MHIFLAVAVGALVFVTIMGGLVTALYYWGWKFALGGLFGMALWHVTYRVKYGHWMD